MEEFYNNLGITHYDLISLQNAITISSTKSYQEVSSLKDLPKYMLDKIMMLDCTSRTFPQFSRSTPQRKKSVFDMLDSQDTSDESGQVHPMDVFLFLFIHCKPMFRQTFITQVSKCQLSIPLVTSHISSQRPTFYLFALKTLYKDYLDADKTAKSFSVTEEKLPIISFLRVGECGKSQKSEMLNQIIGIPDYFFHRNQLGSVRKRFFLDGTVEIAWLLPRHTQSTQIVSFTEPHVILNLRGNAFNYSNQVKFISSISSLVYVFVPINECNKQLSHNLHEFHKENHHKSVYLLYKGEISTSTVSQPIIPEFLQEFSETVLFLSKNNLAEDSNNIALNISLNIKRHEVLKMSLDMCVPLAKRNSIIIDTHESQLSKCQKIADNIIQKMMKNKTEEFKSKPLAAVKEAMLPLQGNCWSEWAEGKRELHKQNKTLQDSESKMKSARKTQCKLVRNPSSLLIDILNLCRKFADAHGEFYDVWDILRNDFNYLSKLHLPPLYDEYKRWHRLSYSTEDNEEIPNQEDCKRMLLSTAKDIAKSSLGIEHIFRELGQVFEANMYLNKKEKCNLNRNMNFRVTTLREIVAKLLLEGHAFEIVDGDINHIAMDWVSSVLESLALIIGLKKKIFVLSILGTQSTGKSTLLNTMFGANFPVSSGRCTRGIFMQLIPIEEKLRKSLRYDYLIILDTEGLRAPELSINSVHRRDNELATIAVGLGDVTLVNMFGEGHNEVQDILQITIFAFIRMKEISSKPRCIFVHQNVQDTHAHTNLISSRSNLVETLDSMTALAARQENKSSFYNKFSDVIEFHPETEVFYFPGLFEGEPPLSRVSISYSNNAAKLRHYLLNCSSKNKKKQFQSVGEWTEKLKCLWNSVLDENFVFSYRNALEVASRFELDHRLSAWHSSYIQSLNDWKSSSLNELFNVNYAQVTETRDKMMLSLNNEKMNPTFGFDNQQEILKYCFEDHKNFEIFCQWQSNTDLYFENKREMYTNKIEKEFDVVYNLQKTKKKMDENFVKSRKDIISKVLTFFTEMKKKGESLTDPAQMDEKFNTIWEEWRSNIYIEKPESCNISNDLQNAFLESDVIKPLRVLSDKKDLLKDPDNFIAVGSDEFKHLSVSQTNPQSYYFILSDLLKKVHTTFGLVSKIFSPKRSDTQDGNSQFITTCNILITECDRNINEYLSSLLKNESPYDANSFHIIIDICYKCFKKHNSNQKTNNQNSLELSTDFLFDFIFYNCCKAIPTLENIQQQFISKTSLDQKLDQLKQKLRDNFVKLCKGIESENACALQLAQITFDGMKDSLADTIPQLFFAVFKEDTKFSAIYSDRASLILRILKKLASARKFDDYISYISNPINFLTDFTQKDLIAFSQKDHIKEKIKTKLQLDLKIDSLVSECSDACPIDDNPSPESWVNFKKQFHSQITHKVRNVTYDDLDVLDIYRVCNYDHFSEFYSKGLQLLTEEFDWITWITECLEGQVSSFYKDITDTILECEQLCPFCNELCQLSCGTHDHYCGSFHRPQGVNGWRDREAQKITPIECTTGIKHKYRFWYHDVLYDYVNYRDVNSRFKSWNILANDALDSKYWRWVLCQFEDDFVKHYHVQKDPIISDYWSRFTEDEVIQDLESQYQIHHFRKN